MLINKFINLNNNINSIAFKSPSSSKQNYWNNSKYQYKTSTNKRYNDFSKALSNRSIDTPNNIRDSKEKKITNKPIWKENSENPNINNKIKNRKNKNTKKEINNQNIITKQHII